MIIGLEQQVCLYGAILPSNFETTTSKKACSNCLTVYAGDVSVCPADGAVLTALRSEDLVGTVLDDRYEIESVIGGGGMGMVYKARQKFINRVVAVKVLHKGSISNAETLGRFRQEAQAASQLSSAHVVTVFDCNVSKSGEPYMVMDYLDGPSLEAVLESAGALPPARALNIFIQICDGLTRAHSKGIVHRDIKPSNIVLVNEDGQDDFVKIVDFGIAKIIRDNESETGNLTRPGEIFGSPLYMSPEQWRGGQLDARTDIYSLGAVMYTTLSGSSLFGKGDVLQLAYKHSQEMPISFGARGIELPARLESIIFKALAKDVEDRFQNIKELGEELRIAQHGLSDLQRNASVSKETSSWLRELIVAPQVLKNQEKSTYSLEAPPVLQESNLPLSASSHQAVDLKKPKRSLKTASIVGFVLIAGMVAFGTFNAGQRNSHSVDNPPNSVNANPQAIIEPAQRSKTTGNEQQNVEELKKVGQITKANSGAATHKSASTKSEEKHHTALRREVRYERRVTRKSASKGVVLKRAFSKIFRKL